MVAAYDLLLWLHVLAAAAVAGPAVLLPFARLLHRVEDEAFLAWSVRAAARATHLLAVPGIVLLFVTGLLMAAGPFGEWNLFDREGHWALAGLALWVPLAAAIGLAAGVAQLLAREPSPDAARGRRLWRQLGLAAAGAVVLLVAIEALMVARPVF